MNYIFKTCGIILFWPVVFQQALCYAQTDSSRAVADGLYAMATNVFSF